MSFESTLCHSNEWLSSSHTSRYRFAMVLPKTPRCLSMRIWLRNVSIQKNAWGTLVAWDEKSRFSTWILYINWKYFSDISDNQFQPFNSNWLYKPQSEHWFQKTLQDFSYHCRTFFVVYDFYNRPSFLIGSSINSLANQSMATDVPRKWKKSNMICTAHIKIKVDVSPTRISGDTKS